MRIPDFLSFTGQKNNSRERRGSDTNRNDRAFPAWAFQCQALLGYATRNRASLDSKKCIAFDPKPRRFLGNGWPTARESLCTMNWFSESPCAFASNASSL